MQTYPNSWRWTCIVMVCMLPIATILFAMVTRMTRPRQRQHARAHVPSHNTVTTRSSSAARPLVTATSDSPPPVLEQYLQPADIGSLGLPKRLKEFVIPSARGDAHRTAAVAEGSTSRIGHVPGCLDSEDVLLLVDSHEHLQAVDELQSSQTNSSAMPSSHRSSEASMQER
jgi:hypothetical protein